MKRHEKRARRHSGCPLKLNNPCPAADDGVPRHECRGQRLDQRARPHHPRHLCGAGGTGGGPVQPAAPHSTVLKRQEAWPETTCTQTDKTPQSHPTDPAKRRASKNADSNQPGVLPSERRAPRAGEPTGAGRICAARGRLPLALPAARAGHVGRGAARAQRHQRQVCSGLRSLARARKSPLDLLAFVLPA